MKKKFISIILFTVSVQFLTSQSTRVEVPTELFRNELKGNTLPTNVQGTPYEYEVFQLGKVIIKNSKPYDSKIRYDAYRDNIEIETNNNVSTLLKRDYIKVQIGKDFYAIHEYEGNQKSLKKGYFKELNKGKYQLLSRLKKTFKQSEESTSTYKKDTPARFSDELTYYLSISGSKAKEVKLKKKSFIKLLGEEKNIVDIIEEKKLKLNNEKDVIRLLNELNFSSTSK